MYIMKNTAILFGLFGVPLLALVFLRNGDEAATRAPTPPAPPMPRQPSAAELTRQLVEQERIRVMTATKNVRLVETRWTRSYNLAKATFTFANENAFDVKDLSVECDFFGSSGTMIDRSKKTIYQIVAAHSRLVVRDFSMGFVNSQVDKAGCGLLSVVPLSTSSTKTRPAKAKAKSP